MEVTPEVLRAAEALVAKQAKAFEKARTNAAKYGSWVKAETLTFDELAKKNKVQCVCIETGAEFWSFTSDLFQIGGLCPAARSLRKTAAKVARKALIEQAKAMIASGQVSKELTDDEQEAKELAEGAKG
jgi:hypothetical protein